MLTGCRRESCCPGGKGCTSALGALWSRAVLPAWQRRCCPAARPLIAGRRDGKKKHIKVSAANGTAPARGAAGREQPAPPRASALAMGKNPTSSSTGPAELIPCFPTAVVLGHMGPTRLGIALLSPKSHSQAVPHSTQGKRGTKALFVGGFVSSSPLPSCPSHPISKLFLAALLQHVSPSGSQRQFPGWKTEGVHFKSASCGEGRNPAEESMTRVMPKGGIHQSRREKKHYQVASLPYLQTNLPACAAPHQTNLTTSTSVLFSPLLSPSFIPFWGGFLFFISITIPSLPYLLPYFCYQIHGLAIKFGGFYSLIGALALHK